MRSKLSISTTGIILIALITGCGEGSKQKQGETVTDVDGNIYDTVVLGNRTWMAGDLKTTRFNDGTPIPQVREYDAWTGLSTPAYCWYNNDTSNSAIYGALYNWYAVESGKLCPDGWHVPTDEEWNHLLSHLRISGIPEGSLKMEGTGHWRSPNEGATNQTGFSALPAGYRSYNGTFNLQRATVFWWTSTETNWWQSADTANSIVVQRHMRYNTALLHRHVSNKTNGFCVRCIKDQAGQETN